MRKLWLFSFVVAVLGCRSGGAGTPTPSFEQSFDSALVARWALIKVAGVKNWKFNRSQVVTLLQNSRVALPPIQNGASDVMAEMAKQLPGSTVSLLRQGESGFYKGRANLNINGLDLHEATPKTHTFALHYVLRAGNFNGSSFNLQIDIQVGQRLFLNGVTGQNHIGFNGGDYPNLELGRSLPFQMIQDTDHTVVTLVCIEKSKS